MKPITKFAIMITANGITWYAYGNQTWTILEFNFLFPDVTVKSIEFSGDRWRGLSQDYWWDICEQFVDYTEGNLNGLDIARKIDFHFFDKTTK